MEHLPEPELFIFGPPRWGAAGRAAFRPERRFQLLALLALHACDWVTRDRAAALLWPEHGNAQARRNLRHVLFRARELAPALEATEHALRWRVATDLGRFDEDIHNGRLDEALAWRRGLLLEGLDDPANDALAAWLADERRRADLRWREAGLARLRHATAPPARIALARRLLDADPLDESAVAAWIEAERDRGDIAAARRVLAAFGERLAGTLGVEPSRQLRALLDEPGPTAAAPEPALDLVGRHAELAEIGARLLGTPGVRWLTLLGPGGVGKSRLAREALRRFGPRFAGGARFVDLQDLRDSADALARVAVALGAETGDRVPLGRRLALRLGSAPALVVLDNAEHLAALAPALEELLAAVPGLHLLVTSRARLRAPSERTLALAGLPVPEPDSRDAEAAPAFDAVRLFAQRAAAAQRRFALEAHLPAVIDIVEAVGGLPLAIELAAAWVRLLPVEQVARELRRSPVRLERDPAAPGAPARAEHRSLQQVVDGSWDLLAPGEATALAALAVFHGGFTAEAAQAVAGVSLPLLSALADKGLLAVDDQGRFGSHPVVAASAAERLARDAGAMANLKRRHAAYFAQVLAGLAPLAHGDPRALLGGVEADFANARSAWQHAAQARDAGLVGRMLPAWRGFFDIRGRFAEGIAQLLPILDWPAHETALQATIAQARNALSVLLYRAGDLARSRAVADEGVRLAELAQERRALVGCLSSVGSCLSLAGEWEAAVPHFERALAIARADGERAEMAASFTNLGICAKKAGRFDDALAYYAQALAIDRELGHHEAVVRRLNNIGNVHLERAQWPQALRVMREGLELATRMDVRSMLPYFESAIGLALFELGDLDASEPHLRRSLELGLATGTLVIVTSARANLGRLDSRRGRAAEALAQMQQAARDTMAGGSPTELLDAVLYFGEWLRDRGRPLDAARAWAAVARHPACEAGVRASAQAWSAALPLDPAALAAAAEPVALEALLEMLLNTRV